jgi:hypothetical protein
MIRIHFVVEISEVWVTTSEPTDCNDFSLDIVSKQFHGNHLCECTSKTVTSYLDIIVGELFSQSSDFKKNVGVNTVNTSVDTTVNFTIAFGPSCVISEDGIPIHILIRLCFSTPHNNVDCLN